MIERKAVLEAMAEFFAENFPNVPRDNIEGMKAERCDSTESRSCRVRLAS